MKSSQTFGKQNGSAKVPHCFNTKTWPTGRIRAHFVRGTPRPPATPCSGGFFPERFQLLSFYLGIVG
jgi:hypothetical protein